MSQLEISIEYRIEIKDDRLLHSLYSSIKPDLLNLPSDCKGLTRIDGRVLVLAFSCSSLSKLLALNNGFIGVLSILLELVGDRVHEREAASTRNSATRDTVSNT